jgi:hypothetical protein
LVFVEKYFDREMAMPTILNWPAKGEWLLANPKSPVGHNKDGWYRKADPPFATLEVNFKTHTGTIRQWKTTAPISDIKLRQTADGGKFSAEYAIGGHRGRFEATVSDGYELEIEFTGTAVTLVNAHPTKIEQSDTAKDDPGPPDAGKQVSVTCAGDIAKWFDSLVEENNQEVEAWARQTIAKHPGAWWAVGLAKTVYDVPVVQGQGMVDALRLGEGTAAATQADGGWGAAKGLGQDALRLLQFIPAFKALKLVRGASAEARVVAAETRAGASAAAAAEARVAPTAAAPVRPLPPLEAPKPPLRQSPFLSGLDPRPAAGVCTWVAATQAVRIVKTTAYITVDTLVTLGRWTGVPIRTTGTFIKELVPVFGRLGVRLRPLASALPAETSAEKIVELTASGPGRTVLFEISWFTNEGGVVKRVAHTLLAYNSPSHGVCLLDRGGQILKRVADLERIGSQYSGASRAVLQDAYLIEDAGVKFVNQAGKLVATLVVPVTIALHAVTPVDGPNGGTRPPPGGVSPGSSAQPSPR